MIEVMSALDEGREGKGATFSQTGELYVAGDDTLTRIRLTLREASAVGTFSYIGFPPFPSQARAIDAMTTRPSDGVVFGILADGGSGIPAARHRTGSAATRRPCGWRYRISGSTAPAAPRRHTSTAGVRGVASGLTSTSIPPL